MSIIAFEVLIIVFLTIFNGVFAMSEIAIVSARKARLQQWAEKGNKKAREALELSNKPEEFLSTVQVGITLVGVLAGAFGGATIAQHLAAAIATTPQLVPYAETIAVGLVVIAITYLSLILGELVPKRIALNNAERIAAFIAPPMRVLSRLALPAVWFLNFSSNTLLRLFRFQPTKEPPVTEDEIRILVRQGTDAGVIDGDERDIIERVFQLGGRGVSGIMTPRNNLVVFYVSDSAEQLRRKIAESGHALFPLCEESLDNVLGVVRTQDLLAQMLAGKAPDLKAIVHQPLFLPDSVESMKLLEEFKKTGNDTALLLDEYGGLQGLVTPTDILKALLGGVSYHAIPKATLRADGSWLVDGMLSLEEFKDVLKIEHLPEREERAFETVGGFIMDLLGRIPAAGDVARWGRFRFEILHMDERRVDKIIVTQLPQEE
ncbi:MAG: HlyC/CorC family transporter [Bacteroidetes bacterium]|nr:HlyC/CorC family transporter [Bacteroidota bacterium]MCW5894567.1 HlyC/CorC family transporter [Bacteroidota bacterium]